MKMGDSRYMSATGCREWARELTERALLAETSGQSTVWMGQARALWSRAKRIEEAQEGCPA